MATSSPGSGGRPPGRAVKIEVMNWKVYIPTSAFFWLSVPTTTSHSKCSRLGSPVHSNSLAHHHYDFQTWSGSVCCSNFGNFSGVCRFFLAAQGAFFFFTFPLYQLDVVFKIICPGVDASACRRSSCTRRSLGCKEALRVPKGSEGSSGPTNLTIERWGETWAPNLIPCHSQGKCGHP